ncbi:hypothetical protein SPO0927 [Ruegeria pomeroyi DSS-3]|uniref:Uncharacterized protein n=1 Tax=Ruegeria pomeroyi (strain ATCC 700808 / DSM 15171 / DSS-3) TaxID=246200 RepID=Q5LUX5_RUEPO|nr:hypothetical protein SPO0927 [Ruegeria pomeroyi DSS-3]
MVQSGVMLPGRIPKTSTGQPPLRPAAMRLSSLWVPVVLAPNLAATVLAVSLPSLSRQ